MVILKHPLYSISGKKIEGYWYSKLQPQFQMPTPNVLNENEANEIYNLIKIKEKECEIVYTRGSSQSRLDDSIVGTNEYYHEKWMWPEGFAEHYVLKYKVRPSEEFLKFIGWIK